MQAIAFDLETTGADRYYDVPVSFALIEVDGLEIVREMGGLINPGRPINPEATAVHGITDEMTLEGISLFGAITIIGDALETACARELPIVGMNLAFDLTIINVQMRKHFGMGLKDTDFCGPVIDVLVIDRAIDKYRKGSRKLANLCQEYNVPLENAHDSRYDALATIGIFHAMCQRQPILKSVSFDKLHSAQIKWHRKWAENYSQWRVKNGQTALTDADAMWPIG